MIILQAGALAPAFYYFLGIKPLSRLVITPAIWYNNDNYIGR